MRRAEIGHHHHIAGPYLLRYSQEASWREDNRRASNGEQVNRISMLAMKHGPSVDFGGYCRDMSLKMRRPSRDRGSGWASLLRRYSFRHPACIEAGNWDRHGICAGYAAAPKSKYNPKSENFQTG